LKNKIYFFLFYIKIHYMYFLLLIDSTNPSATPCLITSGIQTIGAYPGCGGGFFDGYIDQLEILFGTAKTAAQILDDATLVAYYSMDCLSYSSWDSGPNGMTGIASGLTSGEGGRVGQSYLFSTSSGYFQASGFVLLGQSYSPYSFALWIRPTSISVGGTILHVSQDTSGTGWCVGFIGLSSTGQIIITSWNNGAVQVTGPVPTVGQWVHIAYTYLQTHGIRLYINGVLYGQSAAFTFLASGVSMTVTLGQCLNGASCSCGTISPGSFPGEMDEFYVYSRELTQAYVTALANP
jgi:hypothetical protein